MKAFVLLLLGGVGSSCLASSSLSIVDASAADHNPPEALTFRRGGVDSLKTKTEDSTVKMITGRQVYDDDDAVDSSNKAACVTFMQFGDENCDGDPVSAYIFTTNAYSNKECITMCPKSSLYGVGNQYCNPKKGLFHEVIYPFSSKCESHWYDSWSIQELMMGTGTCLPGGLVITCELGECNLTAEQDEDKYRQFQALLMATESGIQVTSPMIRGPKTEQAEDH